MRTRSALRLLVAVVVLAAACSGRRDPIVVEEGIITIQNQTSASWRDVRITVNDHFFGGAPLLAAGARLNAPLSQLQTGFGQRFDRARMSVFKIEVAATTADGQPVRLEWNPKKGLRGVVR